MLEEGGTTYNTTAVNESSVRKIKPPRLLFAMLAGLTFLAMVGGSFLLGGSGRAVAEMELKDLPIPTELVLKISRFLQTPVGVAVAIFSFLMVLLLTIKGVLDRVLKVLIGLNVVWLALFLLASFGTFRIMTSIAEKLKDAR